ncbi:MAG TPA: class I SAM-dependent methyltransferase [Aggregatilineales bacterium]|nr:class I SAM-dependent methyltransferase [Aggregatilineales bacterium]
MDNAPLIPRPSPALADLFTPDRHEEIAFWCDLAMGYGRLVINWHCGTGEVAIGLARRGLRVVGVDPDLEAIEVARARHAALDDPDSLLLTWMCHEPRLIGLPGQADFAVLSGDCLGNYLIDDNRAGLFANAYHHLRPGGALGMTVPLAPPSGVMHNTYISGPLRRVPKGVFARRVSTLRYDAAQSVLSGRDEVLVRLPDGEQRFQDSYSRRLYAPAEIFALLREAGFVAIGMWGGWDRRRLRAASTAFIVRAERPLTRLVGRNPDRKVLD